MNTVATRVNLIATRKEQIFWLLILSFVTLFIAYVFFVQSSVFYILSSRKWSSEVTQVSANIAELENEYYNLSKSIALSSAYISGFVDVKSVAYVEVDALNKEVSYLSLE